MKPLKEFLVEGKVERIQFDRLSNEGNNNILHDIEYFCGDIINQDEEEFDDAYMDINWDKNEIVLGLPNTFTNDNPSILKFKLKARENLREVISRNYPTFYEADFKITSTPSALNKFDHKTAKTILTKVPELVAIIMNKAIPEPLD